MNAASKPDAYRDFRWRRRYASQIKVLVELSGNMAIMGKLNKRREIVDAGTGRGLQHRPLRSSPPVPLLFE